MTGSAEISGGNAHINPEPQPADAKTATLELVRRKWVYVLQPSRYEISGCDCGNNDCQWSEWSKHLWCAKCQKDFVPKSGGLFDGPIGVEVCKLLGIVFHRYEIATGRVVKFEDDDWKDCWP